MELLRTEGGLRVNSFLRLRRLTAKGRVIVSVQELGNSEMVLTNRTLLGENARSLLKRGIIPTEDGWGGWLGRYQTALARVAAELSQQPNAKLRGRSRSRSPGR
jgi:hypothetical protein